MQIELEKSRIYEHVLLPIHLMITMLFGRKQNMFG